MDFKLHQSSNFTKAIIIIELFVVSYLLYTLTVSVYKSYQIDQHILAFKQENEQIALENKKKEQDYSYFTSDAYLEKMAKQNLNLINPGEEVIIIPSSTGATTGSAANNKNNPDNNNDDSAQIKKLSNPQKWWKFFFDNSGNHPKT